MKEMASQYTIGSLVKPKPYGDEPAGDQKRARPFDGRGFGIRELKVLSFLRPASSRVN